MSSGFLFGLMMLLLPQLHQGRALAALILRRFFTRGYVRMSLQELTHPAAQDSGSMPMNHAHARQARHEGAIEILLQLLGCFVHSAPDEVDLHAHIVSVRTGNRDVHILL